MKYRPKDDGKALVSSASDPSSVLLEFIGLSLSYNTGSFLDKLTDESNGSSEHE